MVLPFLIYVVSYQFRYIFPLSVKMQRLFVIISYFNFIAMYKHTKRILTYFHCLVAGVSMFFLQIV